MKMFRFLGIITCIIFAFTSVIFAQEVKPGDIFYAVVPDRNSGGYTVITGVTKEVKYTQGKRATNMAWNIKPGTRTDDINWHYVFRSETEAWKEAGKKESEAKRD